MNPRVRWLLILGAAVTVLAAVPLLFTYEVIAVDFPVLMEDSPAVEYHDGPHLLPPDKAIPISRPAYRDGGQPENPVPGDTISVQRGELLFSLHCAACHGKQALGDGPVTQFWQADARRPANLTETRFANYADGGLYQIISNGIGTMPPLRENLSERDRWDVINFVRTIHQAIR